MSVEIIFVCLVLQVRVVNGVPPTGDYSFAKYNKVNASAHLCHVWFSFCIVPIFEVNINQHLFFKVLIVSSYALVQSVDVIKYTDEEYEKYLTDPVSIILDEMSLYKSM